jgi:hypothetical protein
MEIKLRITRENEDGSADAIVDYDDEGQIVLIQYGIVAMLKEAIEQEKQMGKKKDFKSRSALEEALSNLYTIADDINLFYKHYTDYPFQMSEDEVQNTLLGIENIARMKIDNAWEMFLRHEKLDHHADEETKARRKAILDEWSLDEDPDGRC